MTIGPTQTLVLRALAKGEDMALTPGDIAAATDQHVALVRQAVVELYDLGLARERDVGPQGVFRWSLTDEGRKALNEEK